jgi:uncharacterized RDD family membrane protein YckC
MNKTTYELADISTRFIAFAIDGIILGIITSALVGVGRTAGGGLGFIIQAGYYWYFWTRNDGQSPGKSIMGIKVIKADGTPIEDADAIVRVIGYYLSFVIVFLGFIAAINDPEHQGWHDKLAHTYVVIAPKKEV